jgi:hypothetical protein
MSANVQCTRAIALCRNRIDSVTGGLYAISKMHPGSPMWRGLDNPSHRPSVATKGRRKQPDNTRESPGISRSFAMHRRTLC